MTIDYILGTCHCPSSIYVYIYIYMLYWVLVPFSLTWHHLRYHQYGSVLSKNHSILNVIMYNVKQPFDYTTWLIKTV